MKRLILVIGIIIAQLLTQINISFAVTMTLPVAPILTLVPDGTTNISPISGTDRYSVKVDWSTSVYPNTPVPDSKYMNIYTKEHNKGYRAVDVRKAYEKGLTFGDNTKDVVDLKSGTVYEIDATSHYTVLDNGNTLTSAESTPSIKVKVLTDIGVLAMPVSTEQIKLQWDDVWFNGKRIDYKLYVSESPSFTLEPSRIYSNTDIGTGKKVKVVEADGKLEYLQNVTKSGSVYYFKVEPIIDDSTVIYNSGGMVTQISSYIYVSTKKLSTNSLEEKWSLQWSAVQVGVGDVQISYHIYKGSSGVVASPAGNTTNTNTQITVTANDVGAYFYIKAIIKKNEVALPIDIRSPDVYLKEEEVPSTPSMPELMDDVGSANYADLLTSETATVLWRAPLKGDGTVDTTTKYDIWLLTDPNLIDDPPAINKVVTNYVQPIGGYINEGNKTLGFQYKITNLTPNSVYYFKIMARKQFNTFVNGELVLVEKYSEAAIKVIVTPTAGNIDRPIYPNQPPFKIKTNVDGSKSINTKDMTLQLKNMWYEYFDEVALKWKYIELPQKIADYDTIFMDAISYTQIVTEVIISDVIDGIYFRKVSYDAGLTIDIGCEEISDGMSITAIEEIMNNSNYKIKDKSITPNDPDEDATKNYDGKKHNIDITIDGLLPNTLYLTWVKIQRKTNGTSSELSDPIVVATLPETSEEAPTPIVPSFKVIAGDIYLDVVCDFQPNYEYSIKVGKEDNMSKASITKNFSANDTKHRLSYTIDKLTASTNYYLWIQAKITKNGKTKVSEWSDSVSIKTQESQPPMPPSGFGIQNDTAAITSYTVTFEWVKEGSLEYIIEFSDNDKFTNSKLIEVKSVEEYTVDKLTANKRYYARLYAYDPDKKLKSTAGGSLSFKTQKSNDEFDTSTDEDSAAAPDIKDKDFNATDGTLKVIISGIYADTMIRKLSTDQKDGLKIDLNEYKTKAKRTKLVLSRAAVTAIDTYKEELSIYDGKIEVVIRPGCFSDIPESKAFPDQNKIQYELMIENNTDKSILPTNTKVKLGPFNLTIVATDGNRQFEVKKLTIPLRMNTYYDSAKWYTEGLTGAFWYTEESKIWDRLLINNIFEIEKRQGTLSFEVDKPGIFFIANKEKAYYDDIGFHVYENEMKKLFEKYPMKNVIGQEFQPGESVTVSDSVIFALTVLKIDYGSDYLPVAYKAGLIEGRRLNAPQEFISESEALIMACRIYEIKSGKGFGDENARKIFVNTNLSDITGSSEGDLTRGEMIVLIERILEVCGDID